MAGIILSRVKDYSRFMSLGLFIFPCTNNLSMWGEDKSFIFVVFLNVIENIDIFL